MNYQEYCIPCQLSVRDVMKKLDIIKPKILFLTEENRLIASVTDGDIRRFLLNEGKIDAPVSEAANHSPKVAHNHEEAASLYHERNYVAIPVVDADGMLTDIFLGKHPTLSDGQHRLGLPVVVNAGGKGTRLEPYTKILPKPLIPVGELPIIEHIMRQYEQFGCDDFHIIVNYKKELMKAFFTDSEKQYRICWYDEEKPLGTGGGLSLLKGKIRSTFFFTNCDILLQSDYADMLRFHRTNGNAVTMVCAYQNIQIPYGVIEMGKNGSIKGMREKPELSFLTNTGMYIVEPEVLDDIADGVPVGFPDIVEAQRQKGRSVAVYPVSEYEWMDMGQLSELEKMRIRLYGN